MTTLTGWILGKSAGESIDGASVIETDFSMVDSPKTKFLFSAEFGIRVPELADAGSSDLATIRYALKSATRPAPTIQYEVLDYYNYRTSVATKVDYGTVNLVMYDDNLGLAHDLVINYLKAISPAANTPDTQADILDSSNAATLGALENKYGVIKYIRVYHYFYKSGIRTRTVYSYLNPKIQTVQFDDLDMAASDASTITITFVYDHVNVFEEPATEFLLSGDNFDRFNPGDTG